VDGSDNLATRYLLNDFAVLNKKPYVYGSIYRFEGQVSVFDCRTGPCYRCLFPSPPPPELMPSCSSAGVLGVLPGIIGCIQANETIKVLLGAGEPLIGRLLLFDALEMRFTEIQLRKNPACPVCGETPSIRDLIDYEQFCGAPYRRAESTPSGEFDILPGELHTRIDNGERITLLDVRDPVESQVSGLPGALNIPLERLAARLKEIPHELPVVVYCRTGARSLQAARILRQAGFLQVLHLQGGINAWAQQIDPHMMQY
jgi:adenylyltransferase/sulfurtransferase